MTNIVIPKNSVGLQLHKNIEGAGVQICFPVLFKTGFDAVQNALKEAAYQGSVDPHQVPYDFDVPFDYWADLMDSDGNNIEPICLDRHSWNYLKRRLRCSIEVTIQPSALA